MPIPEEAQALFKTHKVLHLTNGTLSLSHIVGHMPIIFKSVFKIGLLLNGVLLFLFIHICSQEEHIHTHGYDRSITAIGSSGKGLSIAGRSISAVENSEDCRAAIRGWSAALTCIPEQCL